jgi:phosphoribosylcarboxyaminoimidazole (NCAIR) mutase
MLKAEGGHLVVALAAGGAAAGVLSAMAYMLVLSLPASTWALGAADSYAHYGTIPVGLILAAALIELGERSLPLANLANPESNELVA